MRSMPEWLAHRARISPGRTAVVFGETQLSFAELEANVSRIAGCLHARGIGPGDRVAVLCRNGLPYVGLVHAIPRLGAILVPLNTRLTPTEIRWQLADVSARSLLYDDAYTEAAKHAGTTLESVPVSEIMHGQPHSAPEHVELDRTHSIIYTSGTSGEPKGAMLTYGNFWSSAVASAINLGHVSQDRWLAVLPIFHVGGLSILLRSVITGITAVVHDRFDASGVNRAIDDQSVSIVSLVSAMLQRMLDERGDRPYPSTLRCVLLGGGPAPLPLLERCAALGVPAVQTYGLTETSSQVATLSPEDALRKLGSAGKPLMSTDIAIEQGGERVGAEQAGEILVRGLTVTPGYFNRPDATKRSLRDGWFYTGDIGYLDRDGYLYVLDRRQDLIVTGGENVYPAEVESVLAAHPHVAEVGVFGIKDERWGQAVVAAVVMHGREPTEDELQELCRRRLAGYKVPRHVVRVNELPRNAGGKLLRRELRRWFEASYPSGSRDDVQPDSIGSREGPG